MGALAHEPRHSTSRRVNMPSGVVPPSYTNQPTMHEALLQEKTNSTIEEVGTYMTYNYSQVFFNCLLNFLRAADHAGCCSTELDTNKDIQNNKQTIQCTFLSFKYLDEVLADLLSVEHGIEGGYFIHCDGRLLHNLRYLIHCRQRYPSTHLSLGCM